MNPHAQVMAFAIVLTLAAIVGGVFLVVTGKVVGGLVLLLVVIPFGIQGIRFEIRSWPSGDKRRGSVSN